MNRPTQEPGAERPVCQLGGPGHGLRKPTRHDSKPPGILNPTGWVQRRGDRVRPPTIMWFSQREYSRGLAFRITIRDSSPTTNPVQVRVR
jgi:hypothetical protein